MQVGENTYQAGPFDGVTSTELIREIIKRIDNRAGPNYNAIRPGVVDTPARVVASWDELFSGYGQNPAGILKQFDEEGYDEIVIQTGIQVVAMCEHHLLPFLGTAAVAYIAEGKIVGLSKLARLVDCFSRRLTVQERITKQVTDALMTYVTKKGAACVITCDHSCMSCRGVKQRCRSTTSSMIGAFRDDPKARAELLELMR